MDFSVEDIVEDYATLRIISPAYAGNEGEMTAILQYVYQSVKLRGCGRLEEAKTLMKIAVQEMEHAEALGTVICKLGAPPIFTSRPPYPVGFYSASVVNYAQKFDAMLQFDLINEQKAVAQYESMLSRLPEGAVKEIIKKIQAQELEHIRILEGLQEKYS